MTRLEPRAQRTRVSLGSNPWQRLCPTVWRRLDEWRSPLHIRAVTTARFVILVLVVALAWLARPFLLPDRSGGVPTRFRTAISADDAVESDARAARLPRCALAVGPGDARIAAWPTRPVAALAGSTIRLPPTLLDAPDLATGPHAQSWLAPDGQMLTLATEAGGGQYVLGGKNEGAMIPEGRCSLPVAGHLARVTLTKLDYGDGREQHVATADFMLGPGDGVGVGVGVAGRTREKRDEMLAALASLRISER